MSIIAKEIVSNNVWILFEPLTVIHTCTYTCIGTCADDSEFPPPSQVHYVKRRTASTSTQWGKLQRLLKEREQQLEMSSGSMQEYLEGLQNLLDWSEEQLALDSLIATPPAHAQQLKGYLEQLQVRF